VGRKVAIQHRGDGAILVTKSWSCSRFRSAGVIWYFPCTSPSTCLTSTATLSLGSEGPVCAEFNTSILFMLHALVSPHGLEDTDAQKPSESGQTSIKQVNKSPLNPLNPLIPSATKTNASTLPLIISGQLSMRHGRKHATHARTLHTSITASTNDPTTPSPK
jgi:hypothetical protein